MAQTIEYKLLLLQLSCGQHTEHPELRYIFWPPLEARKCSTAQGPHSEVVTNARVRLQEVVRQNGGHIEHVLH